MNLGLHIFNYLQENGRVELPGFGIFTAEKKSAQLDETSAVLSPPVQEIKFQKNFLVFNSDLSKYMAELADENLFVVQTQIKEVVLLWQEELQKNKRLHIEELGDFVQENQEILLISKDNFITNPSYFGLEKIDLNAIVNSAEQEFQDSDNQYVFSQSILWTFLLIIPVGGIIYLAMNYQDQIFGKKSFEQKVTNTALNQSKQPLKSQVKAKDSLITPMRDSLKVSK